MEPVKLLTYNNDSAFAVVLPIGLNDSNIRKVFITFEYLVSEMSGMSAYHKNPFESGISKDETERRFNRYYINYGDKLTALFHVSVNDANYTKMKNFVEIVNISFQRGIFIE